MTLTTDSSKGDTRGLTRFAAWPDAVEGTPNPGADPKVVEARTQEESDREQKRCDDRVHTRATLGASLDTPLDTKMSVRPGHVTGDRAHPPAAEQSHRKPGLSLVGVTTLDFGEDTLEELVGVDFVSRVGFSDRLGPPAAL